MSDLRLIALDPEDLAVISAHLQDAVLKVGDMAYLPRESRFAGLLNRFDWLAAEAGQRKRGRLKRHRAAFRLERVTSAQISGIDLKAKSRVLSLLAVQFEAGEAPQGVITLLFAGGSAIRFEVECIEAELRDLGVSWGARGKPDHDGPDGAGSEIGRGGRKGGGGVSGKERS